MKRTWTDTDLIKAVNISKSYRNVIKLLGLVPAGGNYVQVRSSIARLEIDVSHFTGKGWNIENHAPRVNRRIPMEVVLSENSTFQSFKLKKRLFELGLRTQECELCGWAEVSKDGRIPVELDHINGDHYDNRLLNLRILCPNCHSLQPTHRGRNKKGRMA